MTTPASPLQQRVLSALASLGNPDELWFYLDAIARAAKVDRREARLAVRALTRKGYASYERLFDDDGHTAGSGYGITREGWTALALMEPDRA